MRLGSTAAGRSGKIAVETRLAAGVGERHAVQIAAGGGVERVEIRMRVEPQHEQRPARPRRRGGRRPTRSRPKSNGRRRGRSAWRPRSPRRRPRQSRMSRPISRAAPSAPDCRARCAVPAAGCDGAQILDGMAEFRTAPRPVRPSAMRSAPFRIPFCRRRPAPAPRRSCNAFVISRGPSSNDARADHGEPAI